VLTRPLSGVLGSDDVSLTGGTATFSDKNVANGKTVTLSGAALSGGDKDNYSLSSVGTTTANITAKSITGSFTAADKTYDGNTSATVLTRSLSGVVSGDAVTLSGGTATFSDKNVANGKTVTLTGASLSGGDKDNYSLSSVGTTTANITAKSLTITADNKSFVSGGAVPAFTATPTGFVTGESWSALGGTLGYVVTNGASIVVTPSSSMPAGTYSITPGGLTSTNYAITFNNGSLTVYQRLDGFFQPVDMSTSTNTIWNMVKGGSTVPLKFRVWSGSSQVTTTAGMSVSYTKMATCDAGSTGDTIPADPTGGTVLRYDTTGTQFIFNWNVPSGPGKCYEATVTTSDGQTLHGGYFKSK